MSGTGRLFRDFSVSATAPLPPSVPMPHRLVLASDACVCACGAVLPWLDHTLDRQSPAYFRWAWCAPCLRGYLFAADLAGYEAFVRATAPGFDDEVS